MRGHLALFPADQADRRVPMDELRALWADLRERYGGRLYRVRGDGWYVRPA